MTHQYDVDVLTPHHTTARTDLAEVIGTAVALNLLFGLPLVWGVLVTGFDVLVILAGFSPKRVI